MFELDIKMFNILSNVRDVHVEPEKFKVNNDSFIWQQANLNTTQALLLINKRKIIQLVLYYKSSRLIYFNKINLAFKLMIA